LPVYVGTSGWQYRHWRNTFYPQGVPQARWLEYYVQRFQTVELNNSFYRLPPRETFVKWYHRTPPDFVVAAKMSRYLTHIKKLKDPAEPVARFLDHASPLGRKLGPILIQLPPTLRVDLEGLDDTLSRFPDWVRVAVEFRHDTWWNDDVRAILEKHDAALCMADRHSKPFSALWKTTDWTFLRFHEGEGTPHPCYGRSAIESWVRRLAEGWGPDADVFVYFNNDPRACAIRDARVFAAAAARAGLHPTRVPAAGEVTVDTTVLGQAWARSS
jgi:uncharacterized protein YecE (DUF72 family)